MRSYNSFVSALLTDLVTEDEYTSELVLAKLLGVDGVGSGLDADTLDGEHAASFESVGTADAVVAIHEGASDPHSQYETEARADDRYSQLGHNHDGVYQPVDADLTALAALSDTGGYAKRTASDTWSIAMPSAADVGAYTSGAVDTLLGGKQPLDADLTALAVLTGTGGWAKRTAADTWMIATPSASDVGADVAGAAAGAVSDHVAADDPHVQYETQARADVRYSQLGHTHAGVYEVVLPAGTILDVPVGSVAGTIPFDGLDHLRSDYPSIQALFEPTIRWTTGTVPAVAWWFMAHNGSVYCAIAPGINYCITSPDGVTWIQHILPVTVNWRSICAIGTAFIAVAEGTTSAISYDNGVTWTQHAIPNALWHMGVAYNGSSVCGVSWNSAIAFSSPDGVVFIQRSLPVSAQWQTMTVLGTTFCAFNQTNSTAAKSVDDGVTWSAFPLPFSASWSASAVKSDLICAISSASQLTICSSDLSNWYVSFLPAFGGFGNLSTIDDLFVSFSNSTNSIVTSRDAKSWTLRSSPVTGSANAAVGNGNSVVSVGNGTSIVGVIDSNYFYIPKVFSRIPGNQICIKC